MHTNNINLKVLMFWMFGMKILNKLNEEKFEIITHFYYSVINYPLPN